MGFTDHMNKGMYIMYNNEPFYIQEREFYKPGKGNSLNRLRLRNVRNGKVLNVTMKSGEKVEELEVQTKTVMYSYADDQFAYFMDPVSYDQYTISLEMIQGGTDYLFADGKYIAIFHNDEAISLQLPPKLTLTVVETAPATKGNTATNATKEAKLETGVSVQVPLFVNSGDRIVISTEAGEYFSKEN